MKKAPQRHARKTDGRPVFDSIRKPLAPPGHAFSQAKPDERARPSMRKAKHKRPPESAGEG